MLIREAIDADWNVLVEFVAPGADPVSDAAVFELGDGVLERVASTERPQPNLAVVAMPERSIDLSTIDLAIVADRLSDPGNLGTILRSAEAAGVDVVVVTPGSVDPYNPKVVRATAGALFHIPVVEADLAAVRATGLRLIGTSSHQGDPHTTADWTGRIAIVMGSEAHGLAADAPIDQWVRIEHRGRAESLNVAMATTLLAFEAARQR
ncbi:MAG: rRNA methyltransferase [Acidimicrobiaceae bacterium]|nr:rRNA methyltransferase [Acidimicrobiaceae bacterium]